MHIINTVNSKRFSLNGIEYLKNYVTDVSGSNIRVFNCYDNCDELLPLTRYNNFLVNGISFANVNQLQAALLDVLYVRTTLGEVAPDIDQDNIDIVRHVSMGRFYMSTLLNHINTGSPFTISEKQSLWYVVHANTRSLTQSSIYKYKVIDLGKGAYGQGGPQLAATNLELVYVGTPSFGSIQLLPNTTTIDFGPLGAGSTIAGYINARMAPIDIQPIESGFTVFKGSIGGTEQAYVWAGKPDRYGFSAKQTTVDDFEFVTETEDGPSVPGYNAVLAAGNETVEYAVHKDVQSAAVTAYGIAIEHIGDEGKKAVIVFDEPLENVQLNIPARAMNDTFALLSDIHKPVKVVNTGSEGFNGQVYTLSIADRNQWLSFDLENDFDIIIPAGTYTQNTLIEGDVAGNGQAKFIAETGVLVQHGVDENAKTAGPNSVFGLKFRSDTDVLLFGKLDLV